MRVIPLAVSFWIAAAGWAAVKGAPPMTIKLHSSAFADNRPIPKKYTEDGSDVSPPLAWDNVPAGTRELALVCDDPDAPSKEPWVHWVIYKIPADASALKEGIAPQPQLVESPPGALQGRNSWTSGRTIGYRGPAPPPGHGTHHYHFRIYALDTALPLKADLDKTGLLRAIHGHVLAQGLLIGTYGR